jgi:hypothetical protein
LLTWAKLGSVCLVSGLLLAAAAALAPASSTFFLIDASACIALAIAFYVVAMKTEPPRPQPVVRKARAGWGVNVVLGLVVLSASTPLIKTGVETAARGASATPIINKVTCPLSLRDAKRQQRPVRPLPPRPRE